MEIKLTNASSLNASISKPANPAEERAIGALKSAEQNNKEAAADISGLSLSSDQKTSSAASENRAASRADVNEVDKMTDALGAKISANPGQAFAAIGNLAADTVRSLLS